LVGHQVRNDGEATLECDQELTTGGKRADGSGQQRNIGRMHEAYRVCILQRAVEPEQP